MKIEITFTNSGENDLAELAFCFYCAYKHEGIDIYYPCACHVIDKDLRNTIANENNQVFHFYAQNYDMFFGEVVNGKIKNREGHDKCAFISYFKGIVFCNRSERKYE